MSDLGWNQGQTTEPPVNDCYQAPVVAGHRSQTFHSPVPQEFRRQAKAFRGRVLETDRQVIAVTESLTAYAKAIVTRRHTFRAEQLVEIERRWRAEVPDQFRCGLAIQRDKKSVVIADARLVTSNFRLSTWSDAYMEDSISLDVLQFQAKPGIVKYHPMVLATISCSHAIGRRYERGFISTDEAICVDLSELSLQLETLLKQDRWDCECPSGTWLGNTISANTSAGKQRVLAVRSFL
jgi:hypothetical protein